MTRMHAVRSNVMVLERQAVWQDGSIPREPNGLSVAVVAPLVIEDVSVPLLSAAASWAFAGM